MNRRVIPASVHVDVSEARAGAREAITVSDSGALMNPGEARRLADELVAAATFVDQLAPPKQLTNQENSDA